LKLQDKRQYICVGVFYHLQTKERKKQESKSIIYIYIDRNTLVLYNIYDANMTGFDLFFCLKHNQVYVCLFFVIIF